MSARTATVLTQDLYPWNWKTVLAASLALGAGVLHLVLAPAHLAEARGQGVFFIVLGVMQLGWGAAFMRNPGPRTYLLGLVAVATMPAVLYVATRFIPLPFGEEAEPFDVIGIATLACEALAALVLFLHGVRAPVTWVNPRIPASVLALLCVVAGIASAAAMYGAGIAAEPAIPWLGEPDAGEHHGDEATEEAGTGHAEEPVDTHSTHGVALSLVNLAGGNRAG
ncbi:MAG: hypothetical protein ACYC2H_00335 [Thermoplasmatota archaeon]